MPSTSIRSASFPVNFLTSDPISPAVSYLSTPPNLLTLLIPRLFSISLDTELYPPPITTSLTPQNFIVS